MKVTVLSFGVSLDGFSAGPRQDLQNPLGVGGPALFEWFFNTRVWRQMHGQEGGETGVDNRMAERGFAGIGAWILALLSQARLLFRGGIESECRADTGIFA